MQCPMLYQHWVAVSYKTTMEERKLRSKLFNKIVTSALAVAMVFSVGAVPVTAAPHAGNGAIVSSNATWDWSSVCDGHIPDINRPTTEWEQSLMDIRSDAFPEGQKYPNDYATLAYLTAANSTSCTLFVKNTGWDGEYNPYTGTLVGDNPYGIQLITNSINIEKGRIYTIKFKIKSTLSTTIKANSDGKEGYYTNDGSYYIEKDPVYTADDERVESLDITAEEVTAKVNDGTLTPKDKEVTTKQVFFKACNPEAAGQPSIEFRTVSGATTGGYIILDSRNENGTDIVATVKIPTNYAGNIMGLNFAMGSFLKTRPMEVAMSGRVSVENFSVTAGNQYLVRYKDGNTVKYQTYVNQGESAPNYVMTKKGYTLNGYTNAGVAITKNTDLVAKWVKTAKPAKAKLASAKSTSKKKIKVKFKTLKNARGYQVQYSLNKSFKKKAKYKTKTKMASVSGITLKSLKSGKIYYVRARAYNLDSTGSKVYGSYGAKKKVLVK